MGARDEHGASMRRGLRRSARMGVQLGGLRPARDAANRESHYQALRFALVFRVVLEAGQDKSLAALSRDLFDCGCETAAGKPFAPEMVRRMKGRIEAAK